VQPGYESALAAALGDDLDAPLDEAAPQHWRDLEALEGTWPLPAGTPLANFVEAPHALLELRDGSRGSGIYSRFPLSEGPAVAPVHMAQPTALLKLPDGDAVELVCVHPVTPRLGNGGATRWRAELGVLPPPGELPRVLAGDFNATLDHAAFRDVLSLGYADAALGAGTSLNPTWGMPGKNPVLTLDHVLVDTDCAVLDSSVHLIPGSDHRAVYAEIQLPELESESDSPQGSAE